jgi:hypothetical protein
MYTRSFPKTKLRSPYPSTRFSGQVRLGDRTIEVADWPGMVGHNWGTEHAEQWVWIDAVGIDGQGRVRRRRGRPGRVAGRLTPWIANGVVEFDGKRHRLGGFSRTQAFHMQETELGAVFTIQGAGIDVRGRVTARPADVATWSYPDPPAARTPSATTRSRTSTSPSSRPARPGASRCTDRRRYELGRPASKTGGA